MKLLSSKRNHENSLKILFILQDISTDAVPKSPRLFKFKAIHLKNSYTIFFSFFFSFHLTDPRQFQYLQNVCYTCTSNFKTFLSH